MKTKFLKIFFLIAAVISISYADFYVIPVVKKIKNVIIVSKSGGDFKNPILAMKSITDANETNRYIVKISEGVYDLNETLKMKPYVDIIGAGKDKTVLRGEIGADSYSYAVLIECSSNSLLGDLSVQNAPLTNTDYAISIYSNFANSVILRNLNVSIGGIARDNSWALYLKHSKVTLSNSTIVATGQSNINALNIYNSDVSVINSDLNASEGENTKGIYAEFSILHILSSNVFAYNGTASNTALYTHNTVDAIGMISDSHFEAESGADTAVVSTSIRYIFYQSQVLGASGSDNVCYDCTGAGGLALDENCTVP